MPPPSQFSVAPNTTTAIADHHHLDWFKYLNGEWTYEWSAEKGDFSEKGSIRWRRAAKGESLIGNIETEKGDREVEIAGWDSKTKSIVVTGYSSNGGSWTIRYNEIGAGEVKADEASGVLPDGRPWQSESFSIKKVSEDEFEMRSIGTADGKPLDTVGKFRRKSE